MSVFSIVAPPYTSTELNTLFWWNFNQLWAAPLELDAIIWTRHVFFINWTQICQELFLQALNFEWSYRKTGNFDESWFIEFWQKKCWRIACKCCWIASFKGTNFTWWLYFERFKFGDFTLIRQIRQSFQFYGTHYLKLFLVAWLLFWLINPLWHVTLLYC